jgi:hypothetical protein
MRSIPALALLTAAALLIPSPALAWGAKGHRLVNGGAMRTLPPTVPAFLRTQAAHDEVMDLGPFADRLKDSGQPADQDGDHGHFIDIGDDGTVNGISMNALPLSREAYDTALRAGPPGPTNKRLDQYTIGYVPYMIADGYLNLVKEFAYWRVDVAGQKYAGTPADKAFFALDQTVMEATILHDIGYWGHFVGDASQPLHISTHYNGWDSSDRNAPNPHNYSDSHSIHSRFESTMVDQVATEDLVVAHVPPLGSPSGPILQQVGAYLTQTQSNVEHVYQLESRGEIDAPTPASTSFLLDRVAAGSAEMRDLIVEAWDASASSYMGYGDHKIMIPDIESGKVVPTPSTIGEGRG